MSSYQWLKDYQKIAKEIDYLEFMIEKNEAELDRWVYGDLQNVKLKEKSHGAQLEELIKKQKEELSIKKEQMHEFIELVNRFEGLDNQILRMKYFKGMTLEVISEELNYSYNYIKSKHADIMRMIKFADASSKG